MEKPYDNNWGTLNSNGTWNGVIKMLEDKQVDFAPASFTVTFDRSQVISFGFPFRQIEYAIAIQTPINSLNYLAYLEPFSFWTWVWVSFTVMICPITLLVAKSFPAQNERNLETDENMNPWIFLISSFVSRSTSYWPMKTAEQFASFSLLIFGMLGN